MIKLNINSLFLGLFLFQPLDRKHEKIFYELLYKNKNIELTNPSTRQLIADQLSSEGNVIHNVDIDEISFEREVTIENFGKADVFFVRLNSNIPLVVKRHFVIIVSHVRKTCTAVNADFFSIMRSSTKGPAILCANNYFRGGLELIFFKYDKAKGFRKNKISELFKQNQCKFLQYQSIEVQNIDVNHDGLLDIVFSFLYRNECDSDDMPLGKAVIQKGKRVLICSGDNKWQ